MTKQETTSLTQTFGASLGHIQHHPAVKVSASLDSEQVEAASNELSELLFDPYISRLYHFELSLSAQVRILHVATCRARQHIGRIFGQNHHKPREVAPIYIILSPPRAPDSFLSFSQAVNLLKDHLQLKEPPVADASNRRLHFPSLRLYLLDASAKPLQDQFHHQTAQSSSPSLDGPTGASLLLDTLRADQCDEGQAQFIWHNHASMTLLASVLRSQSFTSATYHFRAVLAADPLLMDMGTAASFAHKIVAQSSSWHHVMKHCKHHNTLFISTHLFLAGLGNKELADLPQ